MGWQGIPPGLAGEYIPIEGRIAAIADVFDALTSVRPYKPAWSVDKAMRLITDEAGRQFDPMLAAMFVSLRPEVEAIMERYRDDHAEFMDGEAGAL